MRLIVSLQGFEGTKYGYILEINLKGSVTEVTFLITLSNVVVSTCRKWYPTVSVALSSFAWLSINIFAVFPCWIVWRRTAKLQVGRDPRTLSKGITMGPSRTEDRQTGAHGTWKQCWRWNSWIMRSSHKTIHFIQSTFPPLLSILLY